MKKTPPEKFIKTEFEMSLKELRKARKKTQEGVAKIARLTQPKVSAFELRTAHNVGALRRYIEALGGTLEITAVFGKEQRVRLKNV